MTSRISHTRKSHIFSRYSLVALGILLQLAPGARAQGFGSESTVASTQVTFNFVQTPDVSSIGSLGADSENDIWATSVLKSVALHFDGTQWKTVPMVSSSRINKVAVVSPTNVWAVGQQTNSSLSQIQHFNGSKWAVVASPHFRSGETLSSLKAISANSIFAVGSSFDSLGNRIPLIEHFNGTAWSVVTVPNITGAQLFDLAIISASDMWAIGGTNNSVLTMHFDGIRWSRVSAPAGSATLFAVTAISTKDVWAVGIQLPGGALTEHWDGTAWKIVSNPGGTGTALNSISAISATDVWAVGCNSGCGDVGFQPPLIEHWDGQRWNIN